MASFTAAGHRVGRRVGAGVTLLLVGLASSVAEAAPPPLELGNGVQLGLVEVPAGTFVQGSASGDPGHGADEGRREVRISQAFWIGRSPVTVGQFRRFVADAGYVTEAEKGSSGGSGWDGTKLVQRKEFTWKSPGFAQTDDHPVVIVTFGDAQAFTAWASRTTGLTVRLPTEAEWEMAAHGGTKARFHWGNDETAAEQHAWFAKNAGKGTMPVGPKGQNELGVQDAAGNVWQWCLDFHGPISSEAAVDPSAPAPATWEHSDKPRRVLKGGSWLTNDRWKLRPAARNRATEGSRNADFGFRIVALPAQNGGLDPASAMPPGPPPSSGDSGRAGGIVAGGAALGCGAFGCIGVLVIGVILFALRAAARGRQGGAAPPAVQVRMAADGFWLVAPDASVSAEVAYNVRTQTRASSGTVVVSPGPQGTFVFTGEPSIDVRIKSVRVVGAPAPAVRSSQGSSWRGTSSRHDDGTWGSRHDDSTWGSSGSSGSGGWPSAY
jgi:sulfatase modifying factor 1